ncbi:MAG TPA: gliding motility protein GldN [Puia sp.]|jgi:gliding motility associated protien GldN|nr:gliding motility protein GldN [Puia sp.]
MKKYFIRLSLLALVFSLMVGAVDAQTTPKRTSTKRKVGNSARTKKGTQKNQGAASAAVAPRDTTKPAVVIPDADVKLDTIRRSLRNDAIIERNLVKDRTPLPYLHIREDDAVYRQRVWQEIDVHEKMNLPFVYRATEDNGSQMFINILLQAIKSGQITAFDANVDDRFTTPMTFKQISEELVPKPTVVAIPDPVKDPDGSKGITKDTVITQEFSADIVERYQIKEEWVFDKQTSRLYVRILGICPEKTIRNPDGSFRAVSPLFWVYYPDLRPMLAKFEAYNGKNFGARMSWEEFFESRMFASRIIKSTIDNPSDLPISGYIKDNILQLLQGENIHDKIFNYEQDLWSY